MEAGALAVAITAGDRLALARGLSLIESQRPADIPQRAALLSALKLRSLSYRIGFTGTPGAGKSTLIDALGEYVLTQDPEATLAVLTVDPSSWRSGGSLLADQTRMRVLSTHPRAFLRTFASGGHLGGLHPRIREAIHLCEAAGFTYVFLETVGTGQSEVELRFVSDFLLYVAVPYGGDEVQGLKRGLMEALDGIALNKADAVPEEALKRYLFQLEAALRLLRGEAHEKVFLQPLSALRKEGIDQLWAALLQAKPAPAVLIERRFAQEKHWLARYWEEALRWWIQHSPHEAHYQSLQARLAAGEPLWPLMVEIAHHFGLIP